MNRIAKRAGFIGLALAITGAGYAQAPANDDCNGAVSLSINAACVPVNGTTIGATQSVTMPDPDCLWGNSALDDDVWYTFTPASGQTAVTIEFAGISGYSDLVAQVYTSSNNTCTGSFSPVECNDDDGGMGMPLFANLAVVPDTTYFIRVFSLSSTPGVSGTSNFTLCLRQPTPPPGNDDCFGAIPLAVSPDSTCVTAEAGTTEAATASSETLPDNNYGLNDDVWYSFEATASVHKVKLSNVVSSGYGATLAVYSGSCGALVFLRDGNAEGTVIVGDLTPGETYYVRVWTPGSNLGYATFDICVTIPEVPVNDQCSGAVALDVSPDPGCTTVVQGTTQSATGSILPPPDYLSYSANDDVWYSFTAMADVQKIALSNISGTSEELIVALYDGDCDNLNLVTEYYGNEFIASDLINGATYYVRVLTYGANPDSYANFDICVSTPITPDNDECSGAISLDVSSSPACTTGVSGTTEAATASPDPPSVYPGGANDDVWYAFTATSELQKITLSNAQYMVMALYGGSCTALNLLQQNTSGTMHVGGLTTGETYYIRVWTSTSATSEYATFDICVTEFTPPPNDECVNAVPITGASGTVAGTNLQSTQNVTPAAACNTPDLLSGDVWYSVTAAFNGTINVQIIESGLDAVTEIYSGTCGNLTSLTCSDNPTTAINNAVAGQTYYVRVEGYYGQQGNFMIRATGTALPVSMSQLSAHLLPGGGAQLAWTTYKEQQNKGFEIQRSQDGKQFTRIGFVGSAAPGGNSNVELNYSYNDRDRKAGTVYYRLQQTDKDGKATLSNVVRLAAKDEPAFSITVMPNPVTDVLTVQANGVAGERAVISITDIAGKLIRTVPVSGDKTMIDMKELPAGLFFVKYSDTEHSQTIKVNKQ